MKESFVWSRILTRAAWEWLIELFHSSHGIPGISNQNIWSNGKRPVFPPETGIWITKKLPWSVFSCLSYDSPHSLLVSFPSLHNIPRAENFRNKNRVLYSAANDPRPQMLPRPEMIPKLDRKRSPMWTANDPVWKRGMAWNLIIPRVVHGFNFKQKQKQVISNYILYGYTEIPW